MWFLHNWNETAVPLYLKFCFDRCVSILWLVCVSANPCVHLPAGSAVCKLSSRVISGLFIEVAAAKNWGNSVGLFVFSVLRLAKLSNAVYEGRRGRRQVSVLCLLFVVCCVLMSSRVVSIWFYWGYRTPVGCPGRRMLLVWVFRHIQINRFARLILFDNDLVEINWYMYLIH